MTGSHGRELCCQSYLIFHPEEPISDYDVMLPVVFQYKISKIDFRRLVLVKREFKFSL